MPAPRNIARMALVVACAAAPVPAFAQDDARDSHAATGEDRAAAAREFAEGQRAFGAGDYRLAAELFEAAYKHKPHHAALWNAARARQRAGEIVRAANLYARYLREAPANARDRNTAQSSLHQLASRLGQLEINAVGLDDVRVDRESVTDRAVYVNPGAHVVDAKSPTTGKTVTQSVSVEAGQTLSIALIAEPEPPAPHPPAPTTPPPPVAPPPPPPPVTVEPHRGLPPVVVYIGAGLTALGAGLTVYSGFDVLSQKRTFDGNPTPANLDLGKSKELRTNILLGATLGVAVLTGVCAIWLVEWRGTDHSVRVEAGPGSVAVRGVF